MESLLLQNLDDRPLDVSNFFAHHYLPKLQRLNLLCCEISSWDFITSRTGALTELHLDFVNPSPTPTTLQLFSIIVSNPDLRKVTLLHQAVPKDYTAATSSHAPLHHLEQLCLSGETRRVFGLLQWLDYPITLDKLAVTVHKCRATDVSQAIGPHLRNHFQRRGGSPSGLGLSLSCDDRIIFDVSEVSGMHLESEHTGKIVALSIQLDQSLPKDLLGKAALELIASIPRENFLHFHGINEPVGMADVYTRLPNLKTLYLERISLTAVFPGPDSNEGIPPSLQTLAFQGLMVHGNDWSLLTTFLARRASSGKRLNVLRLSSSDYMCPELVESIKGTVQELSVKHMRPRIFSGIRL